MSLKEEFVIDLQTFICYYENNTISYEQVQVYLNKYVNCLIDIRFISMR